MDDIPFANLSTEDQLRELERQMESDFDFDQYIGSYSVLPTPTSIRLLEIAPGQSTAMDLIKEHNLAPGHSWAFDRSKVSLPVDRIYF
jgi:hypothetical protein